MPRLTNSEIEFYEDKFNRIYSDRKMRRKRKVKLHHEPKVSTDEMVAGIADTVGLEAGFNPTYKPQLFEQGWLLEAVRQFYDQSLITDILAKVKGGKEATVYRCEAHEQTGLSLIAAKIYRPRMFRNLRNDKMYREGRSILTENGHEVKKNDHRVMRAIGKKTAYGVQVSHTSWLMYEYTTLEKLYSVGAAVPRPIAVGENAILMGYIGDGHLAAPTLHETRLDRDEAKSLCDEALWNIELMLRHNMIHGDLSAYNILYWDGKITLIDFPQVTNSETNPQAYTILERDITRVCEYFARYGIRRDPYAILQNLWQKYGRRPPINLFDEDEMGEEA